MKKQTLSMLLAGAMLFLSACGSGETAGEEPTVTPEAVITPAPEGEFTSEPVAPVEVPEGRLMVTMHREEGEISSENGEYVLLYYDCQTPVVSGTNAETINAVLQQKFEEYMTGTGGEGSPTSVADYERSSREDNAWRVQEGIDTASYGMSREVSVARGDETVVSFLYDEYYYTGGAHGIILRNGLTFRSDGTQLSFSDLSADPDALRSFCVKYMDELSSSAEYAQYGFHYDYRLTLPNLVKDGNWYLSDGGLVIVANPYDIAPYAFGRIEFTVPYDALEDRVYDWVIPAGEKPDGTLWGALGTDNDGAPVAVVDNTTDGQGQPIRFTADGQVRNVRIHKVQYNEYTGGFDTLYPLWYATSLQTGEQLRLLTELPTDDMPDLKISYQGKNGREQVWYISQSSLDGALVLLDGADFIVLPKNVTEALPFRYDLDNDGANEMVDVRSYFAEDMGGTALQVVVTESDGTERVANTIAQWNYDLWLADGNGDGRPEIYFSGDIASDDYVLHGWHYDGTEFKSMEFRDKSNVSNRLMGQIASVDGSRRFTVASARYMLGTYNATREFAIGADGVFAPVQDSYWSFDRNEFWLELSCELKAELAGEAVTLPAGSHILLTGTDGESWVEFYTEDYTLGRLAVSPSQTYSGWRVAGVEEMEAFVALPYYG